MPELASTGVFVEKWLQGEPALRPALGFVPSAQRSLFCVWGALLHALRDAAMLQAEPAVRQAKSTWWAEELQRLALGRAQHPLSQALPTLAEPGKWEALAVGVLRAVQAIDDAPLDTADALSRIEPLASALAEVEAQLFAAQADAVAGRTFAVHLLVQRLAFARPDAQHALVPLHLLARHRIGRAALEGPEGAPARRDYAGELAAALPPADHRHSLHRRLQRALDSDLLVSLQRGGAVPVRPGITRLWRLWRAARG